jgi:hypothetical protein
MSTTTRGGSNAQASDSTSSRATTSSPALSRSRTESWWDEYGGHIEANWESVGLRRYSTLDCDTITALILDPAWSNEGLFALLQGLRRLAEIGGERTDLPDIEWEI